MATSRRTSRGPAVEKHWAIPVQLGWPKYGTKKYHHCWIIFLTNWQTDPCLYVNITTKFKFQLILTVMVENGCRTGDPALRHAPRDNRWANFEFLNFVTNKYEPRTVQYSTVQYSTVQYSTAQHSTAQHSTAQHSTVQYSTVQYSTVQYSRVQYSTVQHSTRYSLWRVIVRTPVRSCDDDRRVPFPF